MWTGLEFCLVRSFIGDGGEWTRGELCLSVSFIGDEGLCNLGEDILGERMGVTGGDLMLISSEDFNLLNCGSGLGAGENFNLKDGSGDGDGECDFSICWNLLTTEDTD